MVAYKYMFMATQQNNKKTILNNVKNKLKAIVESEKQIIDIILKNGGEFHE
jgi:hypothetical protein